VRDSDFKSWKITVTLVFVSFSAVIPMVVWQENIWPNTNLQRFFSKTRGAEGPEGTGWPRITWKNGR